MDSPVDGEPHLRGDKRDLEYGMGLSKWIEAFNLFSLFKNSTRRKEKKRKGIYMGRKVPKKKEVHPGGIVLCSEVVASQR